MEVFPDFKELLELFNSHRVEYLVVGAYAMALHGAPRYTADLDLLVRTSPRNARRIMDALAKFGFGQVGLDARDFLEQRRVVQLGHPPIRIDLATSLDGVTWEQANRGKKIGAYGDIQVPILGRRELIANKKACGRKKDLADIEALGETED